MAFAQRAGAAELVENIVLGHESLIAFLLQREKG